VAMLSKCKSKNLKERYCLSDLSVDTRRILKLMPKEWVVL
jgi:hypothetical protein